MSQPKNKRPRAIALDIPGLFLTPPLACHLNFVATMHDSFMALSTMLNRLVPPNLRDNDISMGLVHSKRLVRLATGALLVLLVQFLGAPGIAIAGCSHEVSSASDRFQRVSQLTGDLLANKNGLSSEQIAQGLPAPARPKRCLGLSCSSRDPLPSPNGLHFFEGSQQWGALAMVSAPRRPSSVARHFDEPRPRACDQANLVFHPPRA
jgi:hypothetical protein